MIHRASCEKVRTVKQHSRKKSLTLALWRLEKKLTIVGGTMRHDRMGITKEIKAVNNREKQSAMRVYDKDTLQVILVPYIDKKKTRKKNVIVLTTMHDKVKTTKDERLKPQLQWMHEEMIGDLLSTSHATRIKSKRRPLNELAFVLFCQIKSSLI